MHLGVIITQGKEFMITKYILVCINYNINKNSGYFGTSFVGCSIGDY